MEGFINPIEVLGQLELNPTMKAADFGCGSGGWVLPLAKLLNEGWVYAIDILEEPLSALSSKAQQQKLSNIETLRADIEASNGVKLGDQSCDLVLLTNILFQTEDKQKVLNEAKRIIKNNGKILVVDWKPGSTLGPKEGRVSLEEITKLAEPLNLKIAKEFSAGQYHWGLILEKP